MNKKLLLAMYRELRTLGDSSESELQEVRELMKQFGIFRNDPPDTRKDRFSGLSLDERKDHKLFYGTLGQATACSKKNNYQPLMDLFNQSDEDHKDMINLPDEIVICHETSNAILKETAVMFADDWYSPEIAAQWETCRTCGAASPVMINGQCPACAPACSSCGCTSGRLYPLHAFVDEPAYHTICSDCCGGYTEFEPNLYVQQKPQGRMYIQGYHNSALPRDLHPESKWRVGFEVEKNSFFGDSRRNVGMRIGSYMLFKGFEADSSCGVEAITNILGIERDLIPEVTELIEQAKDVINSQCDDRCGGHITLSCKGLTSREIYNLLVPYQGVLLSLWPERFNNQYCGNGADPCFGSGHSSLFNGSNSTRLEFRLPNRVKNHKILIRRYKLMVELAEAIENETGIEQFCENVKPLLTEMFGSEEKAQERLDLAIQIQEAIKQRNDSVCTVIANFVQDKELTLC